MSDVERLQGIFDAIAAISKGVKPIAIGGRVALTGGLIELYDDDGRWVAGGPVSEAWAKKRFGTWGSGVSLWIGSDKFTISPGAWALDLSTGKASTTVLDGRAFSRDLLSALEAAGGHIGKRPRG